MNRAQAALVWIAVLFFLGAYVFPLWSISLKAPQYPEGMGMKIWINKITGEKPHDLKNINGLNHYIGMKEIHADAIPELRFMQYVIGALVLIGGLAGILRKRAVVAVWVILCVAAAFAGLVDFYKWEYDYGHDLDPDAPIKVPGMSYQPPLFGSKQLLNITASSFPAPGGWMLMAGVVLGVLSLVLSFRSRGLSEGAPRPAAARAKVAVVVTTVLLIGASCAVGPSPIQFGVDACDYCRMTIANEQYGAEILSRKGRVYKFDSVECMANMVAKGEIDRASVRSYLTVDFASPRQLVDAESAVYLRSPTLRSPMGMNLTAFAERGAAEKVAERHPGDLLSWTATLDFLMNANVQVQGAAALGS